MLLIDAVLMNADVDGMDAHAGQKKEARRKAFVLDACSPSTRL
jgi:hypothetical protein